MKRILVLLALPLLLGCSEKLVIRSTPPGALVTLNGKIEGTTPMVYQTKHPAPMSYQIEKEGWPPAVGAVTTRLAPGRVVGAVFTLGIVALCRPMDYFLPNPLEVQLGSGADAPAGVAVLRLYNVKTASVLSGECAQSNGSCWVQMPSGERCTGDYIRENSGRTAVTQTNRSGSGYGIGVVPGVGVGTVGVQERSSVVAGGTELTNMTPGVALLRCERSIIDCKLTVDTFGVRGHGECTDTQRETYRATLTPKDGVTP